MAQLHAHIHFCGYNAGPLPPSVPLFNSAPQAQSSLEAAAAMAAKNLVPSVPQSGQLLSISTSGPYNPVAMVPLKVAKRVLNLEFVEMAEITSEELHDGGAGKAGAVARPPVTSISLWLERFSVYAAILTGESLPGQGPRTPRVSGDNCPG